MDTSTFLGGTGLALSICGIIYSAINHKHIRSNCCGRNIEFSIDVDSTNEEENKKKEEENKKKEEDKKKKEEEDEKKKKEDKNKLSYTPHNFKIQPIKFDI